MAIEFVSNVQISRIAGDGLTVLNVDNDGLLVRKVGGDAIVLKGSNAFGDYEVRESGRIDQWIESGNLTQGNHLLELPIPFVTEMKWAMVGCRRSSGVSGGNVNAYWNKDISTLVNVGVLQDDSSTGTPSVHITVHVWGY